MMKNIIIIVAVIWASGVYADPGHLIGVSGHGHWLAAGAIGAAIAAGIWGALKGKVDGDGDQDEEPEELQEA